MKIQKILIALFVLIGITGFTTKISAEENVESIEVQVVENQALEESAPAMDLAPSDKIDSAPALDAAPFDQLESTTPSAVEADKTKLQAVYDKAILIDQSLYLTSSNENLNEAIGIAKAGLDSPDIKQIDVDDAEEKLNLAVDTMVEKGDPTKLQALYEEAKTVDREKLTEESELRLITAMEGAKALLDSGEADQTYLDEAAATLRLVLGSLDVLPEAGPVDKSLLEKEILKAGKIHVDNKKDLGKRRFLYALDQARQALTDETKTQEQIDDLVIQLQKTQNELITDENYVSPPVIDNEKLSDEDIIGKPVVSVKPAVVEKDVLPATGMGNLGFLLSNTMIFSGFALILKDRKK